MENDFKIVVIAKNVAYGDIEELVDHIESLGPDFDAHKGDFTVQVSRGNADAGRWFSYDPDE